MKILIAYFSYTGHTKGIAEQIQDLTGGVIFEIRPAEAYSDDYDTTERQGRKETSDGYRPALTYKDNTFDTNLIIRKPLFIGVFLYSNSIF